MSTISTSGHGRTLPFTGFAALPIFLLGAAMSLAGAVTAFLRPKRSAAGSN